MARIPVTNYESAIEKIEALEVKREALILRSRMVRQNRAALKRERLESQRLAALESSNRAYFSA